MFQRIKSIGMWVAFVLAVTMVFQFFQDPPPNYRTITYDRLSELVENGEVKEIVIIAQGSVYGATTTGNPEHFQSYIPEIFYPQMAEALDKSGAVIDGRGPSGNSLWQFFVSWGPLLVIIALWFFMMRQMQGGGKAMSFGKSRAKLLTESQQKVTFANVAGIEESKSELEEIISFLRDPKRFTRLGGRIPKGLLLVGPPGTGKTLLAKAVAGEADVPFFSISGSDFVEMFVGVGASRVRDLFMQGKKHAPCIVFIDEIDAVGRHRGAGMGGGHDEREQTLNQLLVEMDGFESNEGVILVAATNRPDVLDPALLRPGRFDRRVVVPRPDLRGRTEILRVHTKKIPLEKDVDMEEIARGTPGFVGADLQNLANEAALHAARRDAAKVHKLDFEQAKDKVLMGAERRSMVMSDEEKRVTAVHEAGHALIAALTADSDPIHKVTIIPRGMALGATWVLPEQDRHSHTRGQMRAVIKRAMGGRAAEELVFDHFSTGASNDLQQATRLARDMVCNYGMSERLGPISYEEDGDVFLGRDFTARKNYSEKTAQEIDEEVQRMLRALYEEAKHMLRAQMPALHRLADALLERETLEAADVQLLVDGEELPPLPPPAVKPPEERPVPVDVEAAGAEEETRAEKKARARARKKRKAKAKAAEEVESPGAGGGFPDPEPMPG